MNDGGVVEWTYSFIPRWVFLFEKALMICKKITRLGSDVRYQCELHLMVAAVQIELVSAPQKGKVRT